MKFKPNQGHQKTLNVQILKKYYAPCKIHHSIDPSIILFLLLLLLLLLHVI